MKEPKNKRQERRFLRGVNFYRKLGRNRNHVLAPLTKLTENFPFGWNETDQKAYDEIKAIMSKETMSHHPNCNLPF